MAKPVADKDSPWLLRWRADRAVPRLWRVAAVAPRTLRNGEIMITPRDDTRRQEAWRALLTEAVL